MRTSTAGNPPAAPPPASSTSTFTLTGDGPEAPTTAFRLASRQSEESVPSLHWCGKCQILPLSISRYRFKFQTSQQLLLSILAKTLCNNKIL